MDAVASRRVVSCVRLCCDDELSAVCCLLCRVVSCHVYLLLLPPTSYLPFLTVLVSPCSGGTVGDQASGGGGTVRYLS